jgi:hypothetical protein
MNYRHAFGHISVTRGGRTKRWTNVGGFLMDAYPQRVANVMLNSFRMLMGSTDQQAITTALQDGKWDAAFAAAGNRAVGFDLAHTPFGNDPFDYFPLETGLTYQDAFTGFVFYKPLNDHKMALGIPELFDDSFTGEVARRFRIMEPGLSTREIDERIETLRSVRRFGYDYKPFFPQSDFNEKIRQWLPPSPQGR